MRFNRYNLHQFFDYGINPDTKTLYIEDVNGGDEVNASMANNVLKGLHLLDNIPNDKEITIIMNSIGGDVYHGLAIYDAIQACKCKVVIKIFGQAFSMGAIILQAADERLLSPNARLMIHYGSVSLDDSAKNTYRWTDEAKRLDNLFDVIILDRVKDRHPRFTKAKVQGLLQFDTIMSAEESIELGLADGFIK